VLSQLIWLAAIYQVDVRKIDWDTGYKFDLKQMAYDIVHNDPYAQIGRKGGAEGKAGPAEEKPEAEEDGEKAVH